MFKKLLSLFLIILFCYLASVKSELPYLEVQAARGNTEALIALGKQPRNKAERMKWLEKASSQGSEEAKKYLANFYYLAAKDNPEIYAESFKLYHILAEEGYGYAQWFVGLHYINGWGTSQNYMEGYYWLSLVQKRDPKAYRKFLVHKKFIETEQQLTLEQISDVKRRVDAWKSPFQVGVTGCENIPKSDQEYIQSLAEKGDANAQYLLGAFYAMSRNDVNISVDDEDAIKWFTRAAEQGQVKAQGWLCSRYSSKLSRVSEAPEVNGDIKWCYQAAEHGHIEASTILGGLYMKGLGVVQDNKKSHFWYRLSGHSEGGAKIVRDLLAPEDIAVIEKEVSEWRPIEPVERGNISSIQGDLYNLKGVPLSVAAVICGGQSRDCRILDSCGDMVGIVCKNVSQGYVIASKLTKDIVSRCPENESRCKNFVPEAWTCPPPKNMPLSLADQQKYPKYRNAISCGDVLGVDGGSSMDGPYFFISKITGKLLATCSFWGGKCVPPLEWTCGRPSNYGG